ncbi:hypothetical protein [Poseidonocella sedimentorum]|uniref:Uncharacterized protein n=1 Tax=Poseidonocella sedimentorum TaxID=871652 RepID=A0A1I6EME5_9RHOB|nr:hypothetical protein [Poseidonocella sedimentorum]SFR18642.1 hypothetical protein SAMN04515673_11452 [Poseidonocella sedimentorum]
MRVILRGHDKKIATVLDHAFRLVTGTLGGADVETASELGMDIARHLAQRVMSKLLGLWCCVAPPRKGKSAETD